MIASPTELDGAKVVAFASIDARSKPTEATAHHVAGEVLGPAQCLAICTYPNESGVYLFYCDRSWQILSDTWHQTVAAAKEQAEFEYSGVSEAWKNAV